MGINRSVYFSDELYAKLRNEAAEKAVTVNEVVTAVLNVYFNIPTLEAIIETSKEGFKDTTFSVYKQGNSNKLKPDNVSDRGGIALFTNVKIQTNDAE